jgi:hypothetical protein
MDSKVHPFSSSKKALKGKSLSLVSIKEFMGTINPHPYSKPSHFKTFCTIGTENSIDFCFST